MTATAIITRAMQAGAKAQRNETRRANAAKRRAKAAKLKPFFSVKRVGAMTFLRVGPLSLSFCLSF